MRLLNRDQEAEERVAEARFQVGMALLKMDDVLNGVQDQVEKAKEELSERRTSG